MARCAPAAPTERSRLVVSEIEPSSSFHPTGKPISTATQISDFRPLISIPSGLLHSAFSLKFFAWRSSGGDSCATYARQASGSAHRISLGGAVLFSSTLVKQSHFFRQPDRHTALPSASRAFYLGRPLNPATSCAHPYGSFAFGFLTVRISHIMSRGGRPQAPSFVGFPPGGG